MNRCCFLAYSNGANDNFKGVATLFGSGTIDYRKAIQYATVTTFIGSVCSLFLAESLVKNFSGKGLVPDVIAASPEFLLSIALGAGLTVMIAAIAGFPISTTHSLTGALAGSGFAAVGADVNFSVLGNVFFLPLLVSPLLALILGAGIYILFRSLRIQFGIQKEWCLCLGKKEVIVPIPQPSSVLSLGNIVQIPEVTLGTEETCLQRYSGNLMGVNCQKLLDSLHYISAGMVSFARGLNDTPKIVALLITLKAFGIRWGMLAVACAIAAGGVLNAKKAAETMSKKITSLNHGQGFTANIITAILVIFASRWGMPVSTTHVSVGSLFGVGLISGNADKKVIGKILLSWILTLPVAACLSGGIYWIVRY